LTFFLFGLGAGAAGAAAGFSTADIFFNYVVFVFCAWNKIKTPIRGNCWERSSIIYAGACKNKHNIIYDA
jgi:hypothetical protein